jgi:Family of unknown function (DUF5719)
MILLAAAIAAMAAADRSSDEPVDAAEIEGRVASTVGDDSSLSSAWYCGGGTIIPEGFADHELILGNASNRDGNAQLHVFPVNAPTRIDLDVDSLEDPTGELSVQAPESHPLPGSTHRVELLARSVTRIRVADLEGVGGEYAAVLIESDIGGLVVDHLVTGSSGAAQAPCASASSDSWYFAAGSTRKGAREVLVAFNPFPGDAVLDLSFSVDGRTRTPQAYQGVVVRSGSLLPIDITPVITLADVVSADVTVRAGRVVVDRLLSFGGGEGPSGLSLSTGSPSAAGVWALPGWSLEQDPTALVVHNPAADEDALVDVEIWPAIPTESITEPVRLTIRPGHSEVVAFKGPAEALSQSRLGDVSGRLVGVGDYWLVVRSVRGPDVVAERLVIADAGRPASASVSMGVSVAANEHAFTVTDPSVLVAIAQPADDRIAVVELEVLSSGAVLEAMPVEIPGGGRVIIDLQAISVPADAVIVIRSGEPVFVERGTDLGAGIVWSPVSPFASSLTRPAIPLQ